MKNIVVLFAGLSEGHSFEKVFDGQCALEKTLKWASSVEKSQGIYILTSPDLSSRIENLSSSFNNVKIVKKEAWTNQMVVSSIADAASEAGADYALFSFADCPFISTDLTSRIIYDHETYRAEYTFADGWNYGFAPEALDRGAAAIISELAGTTQKTAGEKPASRDCLFAIMSGDINSFEIETVIAEKDYRMLRFEFECTTKAGLESCKSLYEAAEKTGLSLKQENCHDIYKVSDLAESLCSIQKTIPHFYNFQISSKYNTRALYSPVENIEKLKNLKDMDFNSFKGLVKEIAEFSENAVIGLSCFGEPLLHSQFVDFALEVISHKGLSLFIETDGLCITEKIASKISEASAGNVDWAIQIDAADPVMYEKINGISGDNFSKACESVTVLEKYFQNHVYPQFTRMNANESQLEDFFRFWNDKESPSKGQLVIMKYDSMAGLLSDEKPADLSPLKRNPCWHLRRDMVIFADGNVPLCRTRFDEIAGNVFEEGLMAVWEKITPEVEKHINENYCEKCRKCDEFYTFNF